MSATNQRYAVRGTYAGQDCESVRAFPSGHHFDDFDGDRCLRSGSGSEQRVFRENPMEVQMSKVDPVVEEAIESLNMKDGPTRRKLLKGRFRKSEKEATGVVRFLSP